MKCLYCDHPYTYLLGDGQRKCSRCKRKFSPAKIEREATLFKYFKSEHTARDTAVITGMHVATVQKYFEKFRRDMALEADIKYRQHSHQITGYDEYLYLPKSLKIEENIDKIQHFLTLSYNHQVYNIMMPKTRRSLLVDEDEQSKKLLLKYLKFNKIAKFSKAQTTITQFWDYFESFICKYKGVSDAQFIFYLKEAEWRFNTRLSRNQNGEQ
jgi:transposase